MRERFEKILEKLKEIELDYQENKGIILTESDLQCLLFHKLYDLLTHNQETFDSHIKGSPLHSEIKFFNENGKLFYRPDITIMNPQDYSIIHSISEVVIKNDTIKYKPTSSKEFSFGGDSIIIELKFCREKSGIIKVDSFKKDLSKIKKIKKLVEKDQRSKVYGIVAIFNKTDKKINEFDEFIKSNNTNSDIKVQYYTGKFET